MALNIFTLLCNHHTLSSSRTFCPPKTKLTPISGPLPQPPAPRAPFPSMEEPVLDVSHTWTHTPWGRLCLVPSVSVVGLGSVPVAACVGASLLLTAEGRAIFCSSVHRLMALGLSAPSGCCDHVARASSCPLDSPHQVPSASPILPLPGATAMAPGAMRGYPAGQEVMQPG